MPRVLRNLCGSETRSKCSTHQRGACLGGECGRSSDGGAPGNLPDDRGTHDSEILELLRTPMDAVDRRVLVPGVDESTPSTPLRVAALREEPVGNDDRDSARTRTQKFNPEG